MNATFGFEMPVRQYRCVNALALAGSLFLAVAAVAAGDAARSPRFRVTGPASIRLIERGAILAEDFAGSKLDETRWRVWQNNVDRSSISQENGRLNLTARGKVRMEGLWGLTIAKYKDVVLVGEMDIRSQGPSPHRLSLHLCGSDGSRSPDHWVEILMVDLGGKVRLFPRASLPVGLNRREGQSYEMVRLVEGGITCRIVLNGGKNRTELSVRTPDGWQPICDPIDLPLRTIHTEVKFTGQMPSASGEETTSEAWFDNVRIYPRPENHHVGIRLVRPDGGPIWIRATGRWPPKISDAEGHLRSIEDIEVQLRTADGEQCVSVSRSASFGFYLLPLKNAPWEEYPVSAEVRLLLDGKPLGKPIQIECEGVEGLYPDDVYEIVMN